MYTYCIATAVLHNWGHTRPPRRLFLVEADLAMVWNWEVGYAPIGMTNSPVNVAMTLEMKATVDLQTVFVVAYALGGMLEEVVLVSLGFVRCIGGDAAAALTVVLNFQFRSAWLGIRVAVCRFRHPVVRTHRRSLCLEVCGGNGIPAARHRVWICFWQVLWRGRRVDCVVAEQLRIYRFEGGTSSRIGTSLWND